MILPPTRRTRMGLERQVAHGGIQGHDTLTLLRVVVVPQASMVCGRETSGLSAAFQSKMNTKISFMQANTAAARAFARAALRPNTNLRKSQGATKRIAEIRVQIMAPNFSTSRTQLT